MGVGMTKQQLQKLTGHVVDGESLYQQVEDNGKSDDEVLPRDMCYESKGKLVVRHSEKEHFYSFADKIITQKIDDFVMKHVQEKCHQKLNVSNVTRLKYKCVMDTSDKPVKGVTTTSPPETDDVTETSGKKLPCLKEKIVPEFDYVPHTSDKVPKGVTEPSPAEIDEATDTSDDKLPGVTGHEFDGVTNTAKAEYYLLKQGIDIKMLTHDELVELEEELELDFEDCHSDNSDIPSIRINMTTPPLDTSNDTIFVSIK